MATVDYSGYWTGTISGTNHGSFTLDIRQDRDKISGLAKLSEPALGQYEYQLQGVVTNVLSVHMTPGRKTANFQLGNVDVVCSLDGDGRLIGRWKSEIGTEGVLSATRFENKPLAPALPENNSVFLVHGHDEGAKHAVARFLEQLGVKPVILQEQINRGMTVIEKFEEFAARAGFAVVLMTPDDFGYPIGKEEEKKQPPRVRIVVASL